RSLTKMWGLAGVRAGYVVGDADLIARLAAQQVPWEVSTPALRAMVACATPHAAAAASAIVAETHAHRAALLDALADAGFRTSASSSSLPGATGATGARGPRDAQGEEGERGAPFVLVDTSSLGPASVRGRLAELGFAVRRGETFPGLGPAWLRVAVRDPDTSAAFVAALASLRGNR
ncbi:MAG: aminotransferase class I/II-fold pyridoxal phosphate-dependent enzyme, partial [Propionibacteriaceae bacterium]|nr:aminotransferase class I/II-fold pyridoxal phosphate-dependent enzyme [Propionibacteriaceae bacterium]